MAFSILQITKSNQIYLEIMQNFRNNNTPESQCHTVMLMHEHVRHNNTDQMIRNCSWRSVERPESDDGTGCGDWEERRQTWQDGKQSAAMLRAGYT